MHKNSVIKWGSWASLKWSHNRVKQMVNLVLFVLTSTMPYNVCPTLSTTFTYNPVSIWTLCTLLTKGALSWGSKEVCSLVHTVSHAHKAVNFHCYTPKMAAGWRKRIRSLDHHIAKHIDPLHDVTSPKQRPQWGQWRPTIGWELCAARTCKHISIVWP